MTIVVAGSIATDYLMEFPGRISEQLVGDNLESISLSFLVDELQVRRGGIGANIAFGLGQLGLSPVLVGAAGLDFAEYRAWLESHRVDTSHVRVSTTRHTARFLCTTDAAQNQIASFYAGAMAEAREIDIAAVAAGVPDLELLVVSPDDPEAMLRHTRTARARGIPFAADPSQQIARLDGAQLRTLVEGADWLFTNAYERDLLVDKTGWSRAQIGSRVGGWVTTLGAEGAEVAAGTAAPLRVRAVPARAVVDPTGVGDAFRAGFLAGLSRGLDPQRAAQLGAGVATHAVESAGTQEYAIEPGELGARLAAVFGADAVREIRTALAPATA